MFALIGFAIVSAWLTATGAAALLGRARFPTPNGNRMGCVDGLRGYLATSVMVYHFILHVEVTRFGGSWSRPGGGFVDSLGPGSVNLFFMTTGFLFYPRILNGSSVNWPTLYVSRLFRILPLVAFSVLAAALIASIRMGFRPSAPLSGTLVAIFRWVTCWDQPNLFGYPNSAQINASVLWSLWFEWLFYLFVLPICAIAMRLRGKVPSWCVPAGLILVSLALRPIHLVALINYLPLFGVGMLAFEVRERALLSDNGLTSFIAISFLFAGLALFTGALRMACHSVFFICVASGVSLFDVFKSRAARVLGESSYGIYLLHGLVLNILFVSLADIVRPIPTWALPVLVPIVAFAVVFIAAATFLVVERPGIQLGKELRLRWPPSLSPIPANS